MREESLYLLRLWRGGDGAGDWRYSLEDLRTREWQNFARFNDLVIFIAERTAERSKLKKGAA